jgi:hypothetical protein
MGFLANTDSEPIAHDFCLDGAIANVAAFLDELSMADPSIAVTMRSPRHDGTGRYSFVLHRGIRSVEVDVPELPLDEVRCTRDFIPRGCPRLYVDGNSWWWCYALDFAREALADHDGAVERLRWRGERVASAELNRQPRCATCNSIRSIVTMADLQEVRCYACDPHVETHRETPGGASYGDDGWRLETHYLVRYQHMPPEVPGNENPMHPDALCGATMHAMGRGTCFCRRKNRHEGRCESYWREVERTLVTPEQSSLAPP